MKEFILKEIGVVSSPFKERFGIPRQSGLIKSSYGQLLLSGLSEESFEGLENLSYLWVLYYFHHHKITPKERVRPPRFGGNQRTGVFSTRSPFRPNPIGLSLVKRESHRWEKGQMIIDISGHDLLDGSPILDIKPYLEYADSPATPPETEAYYPRPKKVLQIHFAEEIKILWNEKLESRKVLSLLKEMCEFDPRPSFKKDDSKSLYFLRLENYDFELDFTDYSVLVKSFKLIS